jgi:integrase
LLSWLEEVHKASIRPRSYERYEQIIRLHLLPTLGAIPVQKLSPQQVQQLMVKKLAEGLHPTTVINIHNLLHKALDDAVRWGLVARNVCDLVSPPRKVRREMQALTPEQVKRFLEAIKGHRLEALFTLALATGMRRGEILGLKWQDINFKEGMLQVRRVLSRLPQLMGKGDVEAEPKTNKSRRSIVLPTFVLAALQQHRLDQQKLKAAVGADWHDQDLVFCTGTGTSLNPNRVLEALKKVLKQAGLPTIRFHDLRHSAATLLLSLGIHPKVVQELLGHSQIGMTLDIYSHVLPTMQKEAMERLTKALEDEEDDS